MFSQYLCRQIRRHKRTEKEPAPQYSEPGPTIMIYFAVSTERQPSPQQGVRQSHQKTALEKNGNFSSRSDLVAKVSFGYYSRIWVMLARGRANGLGESVPVVCCTLLTAARAHRNIDGDLNRGVRCWKWKW